MNYSTARKLIRELGLRVSKTEFGEVRIAFSSNREGSAYYTTDLEDAVATAGKMALEGDRPRLTLKKVNAEIAKLGIKAELIQGNGYLYFIGRDVDRCASTSVYVNRLNHLTLDRWIMELRQMIATSLGLELIELSFPINEAIDAKVVAQLKANGFAI